MEFSKYPFQFVFALIVFVIAQFWGLLKRGIHSIFIERVSKPQITSKDAPEREEVMRKRSPPDEHFEETRDAQLKNKTGPNHALRGNPPEAD